MRSRTNAGLCRRDRPLISPYPGTGIVVSSAGAPDHRIGGRHAEDGRPQLPGWVYAWAMAGLVASCATLARTDAMPVASSVAASRAANEASCSAA